MQNHPTLTLILCDQNEDMAAAWEELFSECPDVEVRCGDFFDVLADAYVSPANSYGIMDGGIDLALRDYFGFQLQERVQEEIQVRFAGQMPVGEALVVPTGDEEIPYLIVAPTMEIPSNVAYTNNAYDAMRAILAVVEQFNRENSEAISSIAVPGLCTGIGGMEPTVSAQQMRQAYDEFHEDSANRQ